MRNFIRRLKFTYNIYNFFHKKELIHNEILFEKYGIKKKYYSSLSSKDFEHLPDNELFTPSIDSIKQTIFYKSQSIENQNSLDSFNQNGFSIIKNYLSESEIDEVNSEIQNLLDNQEISFSYINKLMFAFRKAKSIDKIGNNKELTDLLSVLFGGPAILFQSINFLHGSEQKTHSDSVHMSTYPLGGLLGVWIALEDIDEENGPLHYYPGSHKLPYFFNKDFDNKDSFFMIGNKTYFDYEDMIQQKIKLFNLEKKVFKAKKGDLLIWHANLLHGGEKHLNTNKTRKSMVFHYFKKDVICYHELTQRPALLHFNS